MCRSPAAGSPSCPAASLLRTYARSPAPGALRALPEVRLWVGLGDRKEPLEGQNDPLLIPLHCGPLALEALQEEDLIDEDDIPVRSFFPENWLWRVETVDRFHQ